MAAAAAQAWGYSYTQAKWHLYKNPSMYAAVPFHPESGRMLGESQPGQVREREEKYMKKEREEHAYEERDKFQAARHSPGQDMAHAYRVMAEGQDRELKSAAETARVQDGISYVDSVVEGRAALDASLGGQPGMRYTPDISIAANILADEDGPDVPKYNVFREFENAFLDEEDEEPDYGDLDGDGVDLPDWMEREKLERKWEEEEFEIY